jgi:cellulose synthase/poly-beta-1,6-N-acetylglucosamine synthase-like glycosyltransferase
MLEMTAALRRISPRFTRPPVALRGWLIYGAVFGLWITVTIAAWFAHGLFAWTVGLLYVAYDTWLLVYVARKTLFVLRGNPAEPPLDQTQAVEPDAHTVSAGRGGDSAGPTVGIVIAAFNEAEALPTTLEALLPQLGAGDVVLVVDDGSHDGTRAMLSGRFGVQWAGQSTLGRTALHPGLRVLMNRHGGKARALNAGLVQLETDLVVTVDADTKLAADALAGLRRSFLDDPAMVAACCVISPVCAPGPLSAFFQWFQTYEYIRAFCSRVAWMRADALLLVSGAFAAFRRHALLAVGGFDPECLVEDYELIHRLHRYSYDKGLDWRVAVLHAPRAVTDAPATLPSFLRQRRRWFSGFLQTQYWNCDMTFNRRYGTLGSWMLPIKAIDTMQPIFGLTAFGLLIVFAATGRLGIVLPVLAVILGKVAIDVGFHVWWVHVYGRWTGQRVSAGGFFLALLAALAEPFSFQLMRHVGAAWGWGSFVTRRTHWGDRPKARLAGAEASAE